VNGDDAQALAAHARPAFALEILERLGRHEGDAEEDQRQGGDKARAEYARTAI
jgi:hypothetical protein